MFIVYITTSERDTTAQFEIMNWQFYLNSLKFCCIVGDINLHLWKWYISKVENSRFNTKITFWRPMQKKIEPPLLVFRCMHAHRRWTLQYGVLWYKAGRPKFFMNSVREGVRIEWDKTQAQTTIYLEDHWCLLDKQELGETHRTCKDAGW